MILQQLAAPHCSKDGNKASEPITANGMRLDRYGCPQQVMADSTRARNGSWGKLVHEMSDPVKPSPPNPPPSPSEQWAPVHPMGAGWASQVVEGAHDTDP